MHSDDGRLWGVCNHRDSYEIDGQFLPKFACPNPMWKQLKRWVQMHSESIKNQGQSLSTLTKTYLSNLPLYIYPCWLVTVVPRTARQWHKAEMLLDQARKTKPTISIYAFVTPFSSFFIFLLCQQRKNTQVSMGADQSFALPFYEKLASHYGQSRQLGSREMWVLSLDLIL